MKSTYYHNGKEIKKNDQLFVNWVI